MVDLPAFWDSLPPGAGLKGKLAQPAAYEARYGVSALLAAVAVLLLLTREPLGVAVGVVLLAAAVGSVVLFRQRSASRETERSDWLRSKYCRHCPRTIGPSEAVEA
ncbi:hypothetical protein CD790_25660 [Streptomyces sp. SAJ15]|nr:hypothetical protein CD790_25660 [Streptomyces sp. SAJ15]